MALYPCQWCNERYTGDATNAYLNFYEGDRKLALRMGLCPDCKAAIQGDWVPRAFYRDDLGYWSPIPPSADVDDLYSRQERRQAASGWQKDAEVIWGPGKPSAAS